MIILNLQLSIRIIPDDPAIRVLFQALPGKDQIVAIYTLINDWFLPMVQPIQLICQKGGSRFWSIVKIRLYLASKTIDCSFAPTIQSHNLIDRNMITFMNNVSQWSKTINNFPPRPSDSNPLSLNWLKGKLWLFYCLDHLELITHRSDKKCTLTTIRPHAHWALLNVFSSDSRKAAQTTCLKPHFANMFRCVKHLGVHSFHWPE